MRSFIELSVVVFFGLTLGGLLAWFSIQNSNGFAALKVGQWTAWPLEGSINADPYSKAKVAADGKVPLGAAEGLALHAKTDRRGDGLLRNCQYRIDGQTPPARFWTLSAHELNGDVLRRPSGNPSSIVSRSIVRQSDGSFDLQLGPKFAPQNWLKTSGEGRFELILRLYDTPLTSTSGIVDTKMPAITLLGCTK